MKVILTETIEKVGKVGQVINVKNGFARNYLIPKKFAIVATPSNLKRIESIEADAKAKADKKNEEYRKLANKISNLEATFLRKADLEGKLFGSVSEIDIINFLAENEVTCAKNHVIIEKPIKHTGEYEIKISFSNEISTILKVKVDAE